MSTHVASSFSTPWTRNGGPHLIPHLRVGLTARSWGIGGPWEAPAHLVAISLERNRLVVTKSRKVRWQYR